jgi:hypothetical protein
VKVFRECRLVDALGAWGVHEARTREGRETGAPGPETLLGGVETTLLRRWPLLQHLFAAGPRSCCEIQLSGDDIPALVLPNGRAVSGWVAGALADKTQNGEHVRRLAASSVPISGPLIFAAPFEGTHFSAAALTAPITVLDGSHRLAAWIAHLDRGAAYPIPGILVLTGRPLTAPTQP